MNSDNGTIIDAHLHLPVDSPDFPAKRKALSAELQKNGVDMGIVIADSTLESTIGTTRDCAALFSDDSVIKVAAGISPFFSYREQLALCRTLLEHGDIVGLKLYTGHEHFFCTDEVLLPVYDLAAEFSVPVLFHTGWDDAQYAAPPVMRELAQRRPQNHFVYCHCFYPAADLCFETLRDCENIFFDISSVADDPARIPQLKKVLESAIREMPNRILFGSDFGSCSQRAHLDFAAALDLTATQRENLMFRNACKVYQIGCNHTAEEGAPYEGSCV